MSTFKRYEQYKFTKYEMQTLNLMQHSRNISIFSGYTVTSGGSKEGDPKGVKNFSL